MCFVGGAFFQIDREDFRDGDLDDWNVQILRTRFDENHAGVAGGAYFIDKIDALDTDCSLRSTFTDLYGRNYHSSNYYCNSMMDNSVAEDGYGANIATAVTFFNVYLVFENGTRLMLAPGDAFRFSDWRSGALLPEMQFVVLDRFLQGPGLTNSRCAAAGEHSQNLLVQYEGFAKATVESPDGLIPNQLVTDVSNGTGSIRVGRPLSRPGDYSLVLWIAENKTMNITIDVTIRQCIINEYPNFNGTLCSDCDTNHYNFHPQSRNCTPCDSDADCFSVFTLPHPGHWNAFPCAPNIEKCVINDACRDSNVTELMEFLTETPTDCNFTQEQIEWYQRSLCEDAYTGPLCGSCTDSNGRVGLHTCRSCAKKVVSILMILAAVVVLMNLVALQIKGNLDTTVHWALKRTCATLRSRSRNSMQTTPPSRRILNSDPGSESPQSPVANRISAPSVNTFQQKENHAKWKFVELLKVLFSLVLTRTKACFVLDHHQFSSDCCCRGNSGCQLE